jgi:hypothetical protein
VKTLSVHFYGSCKLSISVDRTLIEKLMVPGARYDPVRGCLGGTRVEMLDDIYTRVGTLDPHSLSSGNIVSPAPVKLASASHLQRPLVTSSVLCPFLDTDRWGSGPHNGRVFWIPEQHRRRIHDQPIIAILINLKDHPVTFDFSRIGLGTNWVSSCQLS